MVSDTTPVTPDVISVVPANLASWDDLQAIFGTRDYPARCLCQRYKTLGWHWDTPREVLVERLRDQTACDDPESTTTSGLVAYLGGEPVGWCAVEPRPAYVRLRRLPTVYKGRSHEDRDDAGVWAVTCFVTRTGFRRRGVTYALARAAVDFARERGAEAIEGYSMITEPGKEITWGELHVGSRSVFEEAGFREVSHPSVRRVVMRIDFGAGGATRA